MVLCEMKIVEKTHEMEATILATTASQTCMVESQPPEHSSSGLCLWDPKHHTHPYMNTIETESEWGLYSRANVFRLVCWPYFSPKFFLKFHKLGQHSTVPLHSLTIVKVNCLLAFFFSLQPYYYLQYCLW
jgi:hypothetical protein